MESVLRSRSACRRYCHAHSRRRSSRHPNEQWPESGWFQVASTRKVSTADSSSKKGCIYLPSSECRTSSLEGLVDGADFLKRIRHVSDMRERSCSRCMFVTESEGSGKCSRAESRSYGKSHRFASETQPPPHTCQATPHPLTLVDGITPSPRRSMQGVGRGSNDTVTSVYKDASHL